MDPAAFNPSEELKDDIIYNVETLLNLWLDHSGEEFHHTVEARLQQLISGLPWLLGSLPPIAQDFILKILHLHLLPLNYPVQQKISSRSTEGFADQCISSLSEKEVVMPPSLHSWGANSCVERKRLFSHFLWY